MKAPHPIQPIINDGDTQRFKANAIVVFLLQTARKHGIDMNELGTMPFNKEDRQQFAQLTGYTVGGYSELSYVDEAAYSRAMSGGQQNSLAETPKMTTKLAMEVLHWKGSSPYGAFDMDVIRYFWQKTGRKWPKTLTVGNSKLVQMHDKLRDEALTLLALRMDQAAGRA